MRKRKLNGTWFQKKGLCVFLGLVLCPLASSGALLVGVRPSDSELNCIQPDEDMLYLAKPSCSGWAFKGQDRFFLRYNTQSLRGPEYTAKFKGPRVLMGGSSILFGPGVSEENTISFVAQTELRRALHKKAEVINGGIPGFATVQTTILLPRLFAAYSPKVFAFLTAFNDSVVKDHLYLQTTDFEGGSPRRVHLLPSGAFSRFFTNRYDGFFKFYNTVSFFGRRLVLSWECKLGSKNKMELADCLGGPTVTMLATMRAQAESRNIKFVLLYGGEPITNEVALGPFWYYSLANFIDFFTPNLRVGNEIVIKYLNVKGFQPVKFSSFSLKGTGFHLHNDYHLSINALKLAGKEIAQKLLPLLSPETDKKKPR